MNGMTTRFLNILRHALRGQSFRETDALTQVQWAELFELARVHRVMPIIYGAVYTADSLQQADAAFLDAVKRQVRQQVIGQTMRTAEFLELNEKLRTAGATPLVVKGIICRELYPQPDYRQSSDEDVLIPAEQFALCHKVMLEMGMQTTETNPADAFEVPYRKAGSPLYIELHKQLFAPESDAYADLNRFFEGAFERTVSETIQGRTVDTLGHTDHLFYLICHAFKHFLHSGFGIRQVCDIVLFANRYGKQVDWLQVLENCKQIRAEKFAAAIFQIGSKYLVFDPEQAAYPAAWQEIQVNEMPMLADLLSGGLYGDASMSRKHSSNITLDAVAAQKQGRKTKGALLTSVFPPVDKLTGRYPYLKKYPYLAPVAWADRLFHYATETKNTKNNHAADALKIGNQRVALLQEYDII